MEALGDPRRKRQRVVEQVAAEERGRAGDRVGEQQRAEVRVVVAALGPERGPDELAARADDPGVAVGELGVADRLQQPLELVGVPAVVLVAEGDEVATGGRHRQRPLEVPVEPEPARGLRERTKRGSPSVSSQQRSKALVRGAVVADQADPVAVGLVPDRLELAPEQVARGLVGRHADRDPRARRLRKGRAGRPPAEAGARARVDAWPPGPAPRVRRQASATSSISSRLGRSIGARSSDGDEPASVGVRPCGISRVRAGRRRRPRGRPKCSTACLGAVDLRARAPGPLAWVVAVAADDDGVTASDRDAGRWPDLDFGDRLRRGAHRRGAPRARRGAAASAG